MSEETVEIVRALFADPRGMIGAASERAAADVEFDFTDLYPDRPAFTGVEEMRRFRETGPWGDAPIAMEPQRLIDIDAERVLAFVRIRATGHGSGVPVELSSAIEFTVRDSKLTRFKVYRDRRQALDAAGLSE
jgi:ketosteroid isomerase-like protein